MLSLTILIVVLITVSVIDSKELTNAPPLKSAEARIVSGNEASENQFPFHVGITFNLAKGFTFAGGSIISERYILTAAHEFVGEPVVSVTVYIGSIYRLLGESFEVRPKKVTPHEHYQRHPLLNDIAVIETPRNITFSDSVQPAKLPTGSSGSLKYERSAVLTAGWGYTSCGKEGLSSFHLLYSESKVLTRENCEAWNAAPVADNKICALSEEGKRPTHGDSGGALILKASSTRNPTIIAIVSSECSEEDTNNVPVIYTRVTSYIQWIQGKTNLIFD